MKPYDHYLATLSAKYARRGKQLQPPATGEEINLMVKSAQTLLGYTMDKQYLDFLSRFNGLDHNGYSIYATKVSLILGYPDSYITGFVERNQQYWQVESNKQFIAFGESGDERFVFDKTAGKYAELDQSSTSPIRYHDTFDTLLTILLEQSVT
jgi:hypothetical protein